LNVARRRNAALSLRAVDHSRLKSDEAFRIANAAGGHRSILEKLGAKLVSDLARRRIEHRRGVRDRHCLTQITHF
jgi:hypothetical protein